MLGDLAPIMAVGLRAVLEDNGVRVIAHEDDRVRIVEQAARLRPDAVVLDLDKDGATALAEQVQAAASHVKVILWSRDETVMEVLESVSPHPAPGRRHRAGSAVERVEQQSPERRKQGVTCPRT